MNLVIFVGLLFILLFFGGLYDVVWLPTRKKGYDRIANLANLNPGMTFYDLGSGTANLLFYLSCKYNIKCVGIEISPLLYAYSKIKSLFFKNVKIYYGNLFKTDLSGADVVFIYLHHEAYNKVIEKLIRDAREDTKIIIACWPFENLNPIKISLKNKQMSFYLYDYMSIVNRS